jgi:hypothetical protein
MRLFLAALTLGATVFVAVTGVFAGDNVDSTYYTDRLLPAASGSSVSTGVAARSAGEIYMEQHNENVGQ